MKKAVKFGLLATVLLLVLLIGYGLGQWNVRESQLYAWLCGPPVVVEKIVEKEVLVERQGPPAPGLIFASVPPVEVLPVVEKPLPVIDTVEPVVPAAVVVPLPKPEVVKVIVEVPAKPVNNKPRPQKPSVLHPPRDSGCGVPSGCTLYNVTEGVYVNGFEPQKRPKAPERLPAEVEILFERPAPRVSARDIKPDQLRQMPTRNTIRKGCLNIGGENVCK